MSAAKLLEKAEKLRRENRFGEAINAFREAAASEDVTDEIRSKCLASVEWELYVIILSGFPERMIYFIFFNNYCRRIILCNLKLSDKVVAFLICDILDSFVLFWYNF